MKLFRIFIFVFLCTLYFVLCPKVNAQDCTDTNDPEFHSLRPYPGSPCLTAISDTASFCGDSLALTDNIKITYNPDTDNCVSIPGGKVRCTYSKNQNKKIKIDLSEAELPIMGNTEDVFNSQNPITSDGEKNKKRNISPEERVNNYVSWYLNGIFNRAEYSPIALADPNASPAPPSIVDFSGPINKLLPQEVAFQSKINTVKQAGKTRHNQIVGCTYSVTTFFGLIHIGRIPGPCYIDSVALDILKIIFKIDDEKWRLKNWENKLPPLRSDFDNYTDYYVKYQEWRGKKCWQIEIPESILGIKIPIFGGLTIVACGDDPTNPNFYGTMFSYIPLSSTEDRKGEVTASGSVGSIPGVTISNVSSSFTNATLYFAHMQEATESASTLQDTFAYKGADKFAAGNSVPVNTAGSCKMVDVRSGPGDSLLPTPSSITGNIAYTTTFTCDFDPPSNTCAANGGYCAPSAGECGDDTCGGGYDCALGDTCCRSCTPVPPPPTQTCTKVIPITINTTTETPLADKVWAQLVSGTSSVFRRIFPKLGSGSQIGEVKDIPASTKVTYSGDVSGTGELKFPHIGGISEYFLKGIQTMLRPKGYGEAISFGGTSGGGTCGNIPDLPSAEGACKLTSTNINGIALPPTLINIFEAAAQSYHTPPGLILGVLFGESAFNNPGKYDWTEENVKNWSMGCAIMPGCSPTDFPSTGIVSFFETYWNQLKDAVAVVDPDREPNPCNLLDAIFASAKTLSQSQYGSGAFAGKTCYGIALNSGGGGSSSCSWSNSGYESAIRIWEFGTAYNSTYTCGTNPKSCATGGMTAACPGGDFCEKIGGAGNTSHNACVWNVAHSH